MEEYASSQAIRTELPSRVHFVYKGHLNGHG